MALDHRADIKTMAHAARASQNVVVQDPDQEVVAAHLGMHSRILSVIVIVGDDRPARTLANRRWCWWEVGAGN